jgi:hypothetical protein
MRKKNLCLVIVLFILSATVAIDSCKKSDTPNTASDTYYPLGPGTVRIYNTTIWGGNTEILDSVTNVDTMINGYTYRIIKTTDPESIGHEKFVRIANGNIYGIVPNGLEGFGGHSWNDCLFMKENSQVGDNWISSDDSPLPSYVREVTQTGASITVGSQTFTNVVVLRQYPQGNPGSADIFYYAKGIGFIKEETYSGITSYTIK